MAWPLSSRFSAINADSYSVSREWGGVPGFAQTPVVKHGARQPMVRLRFRVCSAALRFRPCANEVAACGFVRKLAALRAWRTRTSVMPVKDATSASAENLLGFV
jgi:hypothetical protein